MHQPFDMSPGELPGLYAPLPGPDDEWPEYWDDYAFAFCDEPEADPQDEEPEPRTWFADLETLKGTLLCRHEFPEPVNVKNGDILEVKYTLGIDGETVNLTDVRTRVYPDPDYIPAQ